jgi:hypothetical protein
MGFCRAAVISPLNGDAMVVQVTGGGVAALGEVRTAGVEAAELAKKFRLGGPLPRGIHSSYFRHWKPMNVSPLLRDGVFVELTAVGDTDNGVNADANWKKVISKKRECEAAVLAILEAPDSSTISELSTHRLWKTKKNGAKVKSINKSIEDAKKNEKVIKAKKMAVAMKKKAATKRKATTASAAETESIATVSIDLTEQN